MHVRCKKTLRLRELDDFKNRFFTNITHEFPTPLTVILGMSDKILKEKDGKDAVNGTSAALRLIKRNGENLLRLINQILDLAKWEDNTLHINYVQGNLLAYLCATSPSITSWPLPTMAALATAPSNKNKTIPSPMPAVEESLTTD